MAKKKEIPFEFILDHLEPIGAHTKAMFGHTAVYVGNKMILYLVSERGGVDHGVCLATTKEHIPSLQKDFPALTHLEAYGPNVTDWRLIPASSPDFEECVVAACDAIVNGDPRIGRFPKGQFK